MGPVTAEELARARSRPIGARIPAASWAALAASGRTTTLPRHTVLFAAGDAADAFYLVRAGVLEVVAGGPTCDDVVARLGPGDCFGEAGLGPGGGRRAATVRSVGAVTLLRVEAEAFRQHAAAHVFAGGGAAAPSVRQDLTALAGLAEDADALGQRERYAAGAVVVRQGDPGDSAWFVLDGYARVVDERGGRVLGSLGPGQCFGELALLRGGPREATVEATTELAVIRLPREPFLRWAAGHPPLRTLLATMQRAYTSAEGGGSTTVFAGEAAGEPCVTSIVRTEGGHGFVASRVVGRERLVLAREARGGAATETLLHERAEAGRRRTLTLVDGRPVEALLDGDLSGATSLAERLRDERPLTEKERARFRWTGLTGRPQARPGGGEASGLPGGARLVCGCVGLTRGELGALTGAGATLEDVVARTGATGVCGSCVRALERAAGGGGLALDDEVTADDLELRLESLAFCPDPRDGLLGPDSVTWRLLGESSAMLGGGAAILLQLAHPAVAEGLVAHSTIGDDPGTRFRRTMSFMYSMSFGDRDLAVRLARDVHDMHANVVGTFERPCGRHAAGERYAANHVEALLWVAMTLTHSAVLVHEDLHGPLAAADKDRFTEESAAYYGLFGIPEAVVPQGWRAFEERFGQIVAERLAVGDAARRLAKLGLGPPGGLAAVPYRLTRPLTARWLPEPIRAAFGLRYGPLERAASEATLGLLRRVLPKLPPAVRHAPARVAADRRLAGLEGPHPVSTFMKHLAVAVVGGKLPRR